MKRLIFFLCLIAAITLAVPLQANSGPPVATEMAIGMPLQMELHADVHVIVCLPLPPLIAETPVQACQPFQTMDCDVPDLLPLLIAEQSPGQSLNLARLCHLNVEVVNKTLLIAQLNQSLFANTIEHRFY